MDITVLMMMQTAQETSNCMQDATDMQHCVARFDSTSRFWRAKYQLFSQSCITALYHLQQSELIDLSRGHVGVKP